MELMKYESPSLNQVFLNEKKIGSNWSLLACGAFFFMLIVIAFNNLGNAWFLEVPVEDYYASFWMFLL